MPQPAVEKPRTIGFRRMSLLDVGRVHAIERESFPTPWRRRGFISRLRLSDHYGYVAEADGDVVGYIIFRISMGTVHLQKIAVAEKYRRRGIATRLMQIMLEQVRAEGAETVILEVRASNSVAQEFYRKFHFVLHHIEANYYRDTGEPAQILVRTVGQETDEALREPP